MTFRLTIFLAGLCIAFGLSTCSSNQPTAEADSPSKVPHSTIYGAWELTYGKYGIGTENEAVRNPEKPFQLKVFSDHHFILIMQDGEGAWSTIAGGDYVLEGNQYIETARYSEIAPPGEWLRWNYDLNGDTLLMSGPTQVSDGMTANFALNSMDEVRIRAAKNPTGSEVPAGVIGAWHLTYGSYTDADGKVNVRNPESPFQLSIYTPTHFAYIMQGGAGKWTMAGGGPHYIDQGKRYEQHLYQTTASFVGWTAGFEYETFTDSLLVSGPISVTDAAGQDLSDQFKNRWKETRVRIE